MMNPDSTYYVRVFCSVPIDPRQDMVTDPIMNGMHMGEYRAELYIQHPDERFSEATRLAIGDYEGVVGFIRASLDQLRIDMIQGSINVPVLTGAIPKGRFVP